MHWSIAAPFFQSRQSKWLDDHVQSGRHTFTKIPAIQRQNKKGWHSRSQRNTPIYEWLNLWEQSGCTLAEAQDGCITLFPQLANLVGWRKIISRDSRPLVAWCFNVGTLYDGIRKALARGGLSQVDRFIVHSNGERQILSEWLRIPIEKFDFVHLQMGHIKIEEKEEMDEPFILAMGSAHRDYETLFQAVGELGTRTIVVANPHRINSLKVPENVQIRSGLSHQECRILAQKARISIVPLKDTATAVGQVTIVEAMTMARPVIATHCIGSTDYINNMETGVLVPPYSAEGLQDAISTLWHEEKLRHGISIRARDYAAGHFSDSIAAAKLKGILDQF